MTQPFLAPSFFVIPKKPPTGAKRSPKQPDGEAGTPKRITDTQSRLFNEYNLLLNGTGASEGLFNPGADNQNFYFRTAKEWELSRLEKDLAEAGQNLARKENIRNLSMTPTWSASAQADAEAEWKDAEQKYNDAKAAYEAKKLEADTYYANAVTTHLSNMAGLSAWLSAESVHVSEANSNYFLAMDAYQAVVTNASSSTGTKDAVLEIFRAAQDTYTNAKVGYEASNAIFKTMRSTKDDLMKIYYGLLGESDGLYSSMISADHNNQIKRDSFDTIKYVDYLDTNETQAAYLAAQAAYDSLKTQRDAAAAAVSGANVYDFFGDSGNAGLLSTERYKLSELASWEGRAYQDLWNVDGNGFVGSGIKSFISSRSMGLDIGNQTGDFIRDMGTYTSGGDKITTQLIGLPADTKYWSEDQWVSNLIEVAVKGNNIPLSQSRTIHNGEMVMQVTTRSNAFMGTVTAVTNQVALTGGDWNVSARYSWDVNQVLRETYNHIRGSYGDNAVRLMVEGVTNLGLKWNDTRENFLTSATNRIAGIKGELAANHLLITQNVSNQIANGADERRLYGDLSKFYFDNMQSVNGIYGTGNAFGSAQGYLSDLIPTLVNKNKIGQYDAQIDAYSRQIKSVMADRDSWQSLISKIQTKGEADWDKTFADMVSAFNDWNNRYAEDTYNAKLNWKAKNDDLNAHKYLWAQYATADITEGQRSAYFNELRSTMDAMIGDVFENMPKDVQGDTASLKNKDAALARMESLIKIELSQSLAHRGDSINTLFANTEVGKLYFVGNQELHTRLEKNMEDTERIALNLRNSQMYESVAQSQRARENAINGMDESTAQGLEEQMKSQGYARRGDKWYRRVVIDSSLAGDKYADQYVTTYKSHQHVDVPFTLTLQQILKEVPEVASYLIEKASKAITAKYEEYLGKEGDFESDGKPKDSIYTSAKMFTWVGRAPDFYNGNEKYTVRVSQRFQVAGGRNPTYTNGFANEERTRDPMEIRTAGSGEMNQLSMDIRANGIAANRGEQARNVPFFAKKLWDDDADNDGKPDLIAAPSLTTIASIAAAFLPPPINLIASGAIQVGTSIASGVYYGRSAAEIVLDAGKSVALTAVGALTGGLGSGILGAASTTLVGSIAAAGISSIASSAANTLVGAVNMKNGYLNFDTSGEYWSKAGENALQSLAISAVGAGVSFGVNSALGGHQVAVTHENANGTSTTSTRWDYRAGGQNLSGALASRLGQVGSFAGSLASSLTGAAMGRDFNLNVGGAIDVNLSKLTRGDYSGVIQAGNTGLRADAIVGAIQGIQAAGWLDRESGLGDAGAGRINIANMLGNTSDRFSLQTMDEIIGGSKQVSFEDLHGDNGRSEGNNRIILDNRFMSRAMEQGIMGASAAVHENTHLVFGGEGDAAELMANKSGLNTFRDLASQFGSSINWGDSDMRQMMRLDVADRAGMLGQYIASSYKMSGEDWGWKDAKTKDTAVLAGETRVDQVLGQFMYNAKGMSADDIALFKSVFMSRNRDKINADGTFKSGTTELWSGTPSAGEIASFNRFQSDMATAQSFSEFAGSIAASLFGGQRMSDKDKSALLSRRSGQLGGELNMASAAFDVESQGVGFDPASGKMIVRLEAHLFDAFTEGKYKDNFKTDGWKNQLFRESASDSWVNYHAKQDTEWKVLNWAMDKDQSAALRATSMGAPQILGDNYAALGYNSPREMFNSFRMSDKNQFQGFFNLIGSDSILKTSFQNKDFLTFAIRYNGRGQYLNYSKMLQDAYSARAK